jgi:CDP-glucose 4,6-dehydratase
MFESYRQRKVLLTGHTGFKGSWLALWLTRLGADVTGIALPPESKPNHWDLLKLKIKEQRLDIRDAKKLHKAIDKAQPEMIFHLAAQSLVRRSYREPLDNWSTNVMGTVNLLEACRHVSSVKAVVIVTTDKCYENRESPLGYCESDRLGGHDPYSASKAATELVAASYRRAFFSQTPLIATARAGNVIGGGDWSEDRLIPDLMRALKKHTPLAIRAPDATRPWQHVLDPLAGYLRLGEALLTGKREFADAWNFGPDAESMHTVAELLEKLRAHWPKAAWHTSGEPQPHETTLLKLDSSKARSLLGWKPRLPFDEQLALTADWYRSYFDTGKAISARQLDAYMAAA